MKRWLRRIAKGLVVLVVLIMLVPLMVIAALQNDQVRSLAVSRILTDVNEELAGSIELDRVEGSLLGHAQLHGLQLVDARGNLAAHVETAELYFRILPFLSRSVVVDEVAVDNATVVVRTYEDEIMNWGLVAEPDPEPDVIEAPLDWLIEIADISLRDGSVLYLDETLELDEQVDGLGDWRRQRIDGLDASATSEALRQEWAQGFESEATEPLASPRAPLALWFDDVSLDAEFQMLRDDLVADVSQLSTRIHGDIFPHGLDSSISDLGFAMGRTSMTTELATFALGDWLSAEQVEYAMLTPPRSPPAGEEAMLRPDVDPFEQIFIDLGHWTINQAPLVWAAPDIETAAPLFLKGQLALDPDTLYLSAELDHDGAAQPLEATLRLDDYAQEIPEYEAALAATDFEVHTWLLEPQIPSLQTTLQAHGQGQGFDPDELSAALRVRLDDTLVDETYEAEIAYASVEVSDGVVDGHRVTALTPYLDLFASFRFDPEGYVTLAARTTADDEQGVRAAALTDIRPARAELELELDAQFDPDFEDVTDALIALDASTSWDFSEFTAEDIRIAQSSGDAAASLERVPIGDDELIYRGDYQIGISGSGLEMASQRLGSLRVDDEGTFQIAPFRQPPINAAEEFRNNATVEIRNLWTPQLQLGYGRFTVRARKADAQRRQIQADIGANMQRLRSDDIRADRLQSTINTRLRLGTGTVPIDRIGAQIVANAQGINANGITTETVEATLDANTTLTDADSPIESIRDLELDADIAAMNIEMAAQDIATDRVGLTAAITGTPANPAGNIRAESQQISIGEEVISRAEADATFLDAPGSAHVGLDVWREDEEYHLGSELRMDPDFQTFELSKVRVATGRTEWLSRPDGLLRWTGARVEAENFRLENEEQLIAAAGHFTPDVDQDLRVRIDLDIGEFLHDFYLQPFLPATVEGHFDVELALDGTSSQPRFDINAQVKDVVAGLTDLDLIEVGPFSAHLSAAYSNERLRIRNLEAEAFGDDIFELSGGFAVALDMQGNYEVFPERNSELSFQLFPQELRNLHEPLPILNEFGIDGIAELDLDWSGTLAEPHVDLELLLEEFRFQGEVGDDFLNLRDIDLYSRVHYEPAAVGGQGLDLTADLNWEDDPVLELLARTPIPLEEWIVSFLERDYYQLLDWYDELLALPLEFQLLIPSLELDRLPVEQLQEENLAGEAAIDIDLQGTLLNLAGHVNLDLRQVGWAHFRNFTFNLDANIRDQHIFFERMDLAWARDEIFAGRGIIPLPMPTIMAGDPVEDLPLDFHWQLHDLPISRLSAIDYEFARIAGYMGASLRLGGSLRSPQIDADAGIFETRLGDGSSGDIQVHLTGSDDRIALEGALTREDEPFLRFDGDAPVVLDFIELSQGANWQAPGQIRADLESVQVDLADVVPAQLLTNFILDPEGLFSVDAQIRGSWDQPRISGDAELTDGAITLPEFGRGFDDINARLDLDAEELSIEYFTLRDGPSSLALDGTIEHELLIPGDIDLALSTDQFNIGGIATDFPVFVTADTTIRGVPLDAPGELDIHVTNLNAVLSDEWDRALHETTVDPDIILVDGDRDATLPLTQIIGDESAEMDGIDLVVNITVDRNAWARHPAGDLNFRADLNADISGTVVAITGNVDVMRGNLEFLGRRFNVQTSEVNFTGSIPPNPRLQIEAHHILDRAITQALGPPTSGEPRVIVRISGTAENPRLELQSDPAMTDTEILFVLMTGRPPDRTDVGRDEGAANQALSAVSGIFFDMLQDELSGNVPFDVVRLEPGVPGGSGGRLEVGTYVTNNLFFTYRHQFGANEDRAANVFRLEYHFLPRWMVELLYTDHNEGEFNLFWDAL